MSIKLLMLGFLVDSDTFDKGSRSEPYQQIAARKFELGFLRGFLDNGVCIKVFGCFPSSTFPINRTILFGFKPWKFRSASCLALPFINLPGLKLATRFFSSLFALTCQVIFIDRPRAICIYSAHSSYLLAAYIARVLYRIPFFVIIPDLPEFMNIGLKRSRLHQLLKAVDGRIIRHLVSKSSGISAITEFVTRDVPAWADLPSVVVEGIAPDPVVDDNVADVQSNTYFLYSGGLNEAYGVGTLVRAFMSSNIKAELWICGAGPLSEFVKECAERDGRIRSLGFLSQIELRRCQKGATALLMTRSCEESYVRYSFPSKLLEYLTTGVPVIATMLPGIPESYISHITIMSGSSESDILDALQSHLLRDPLSRKEQGERALKFVTSSKNAKSAVMPFLELMYNLS